MEIGSHGSDPQQFYEPSGGGERRGGGGVPVVSERELE